jgi:hypothetical protein
MPQRLVPRPAPRVGVPPGAQILHVFHRKNPLNTAAISWGMPRRVLAAFAFALMLGAAPLAAQQDASDSLDALQDQPAAPAKRALAPGMPGQPGGLEDIQGEGGGLEGLESTPPKGTSAAPAGSAQPKAEDAKALKITFNGYVKPLAVWETRTVPEAFKSAGAEDLNRFTAVGARTQLRAQGVIKDKAQFFTAANLDFNEVNRGNDTTSTTSEKGDLRMVEAYIDLFGESTRWRAGSQLVTWGFMDGFEVPVDRFNARDTGYKSVELEDLKLAETGLEFSWTLGVQRMDWFYVPVSKVNRLPPEFERAFIHSGDTESTTQPVTGTDVQSNNSKYAVQFSGTVSPVDYQLNYVDTVDPRTDLVIASYPASTRGAPYAKEFHRTRSPGVDLQFDLGSVLARISTVYFNTDDSNNNDPLIQNDWYQFMVGAEFHFGPALMQINAGRKEVVDWGKGQTEDEQNQAFINNVFLGQPAKSTNIVAGTFSDSYFTGAALKFNLLWAYLWNADNGDLVAVRLRPYFSYNFADGLAITLMPSFSNEVGVQTFEIYSEVKLSF